MAYPAHRFRDAKTAPCRARLADFNHVRAMTKANVISKYEIIPVNHGLIKDLTGRIFGRLKVIGLCERRPSRWACECRCGKLTKVATDALLRERGTRSCGCINRESLLAKTKTHGLSNSPEYRVWNAMVERCSNPKNIGYENYGGRGIKVCERWMKFSNFISDMGRRPLGGTIERENNNGDYEPANCSWNTHAQQSLNKRTNRVLVIDGQSMTCSQWADKIGIGRSTLCVRLRKGWTPRDAVLKPLMKNQHG